MPFRLVDAIFWIAVACCVIAQAAIVRSIVSSSAARAADSATPPSASRRASEIAWAVIPGIALAVVLVYTHRAMS